MSAEMMSEVFSGALPLICTAGFASGYLMCMSVANLSGRLAMATLSDSIGCKRYTTFGFSSQALFLRSDSNHGATQTGRFR
jgi:hypothetical protein